MPVFVRVSIHAFQHDKPKQLKDLPYSWTQPVYVNNNQILLQKAPAEEFDEHNQKRLQKIVGKLLYYVRAINSTMLMALNYLEAVQTKPTI